ncbi:MAG: DUF3141 domain-containing protein [Burkholderiales bacterium]|nr:DUF3141 domain-containing protein [Burkholderiales bacterium]
MNQNLMLGMNLLQNKIPLTANAKQFQEYMLDFMQRSSLFMDVMRKRGNEMLNMTKDNSSTVLNFKFEKLMDGSNFERPINYWLARILPPEGVLTDNNKRPYLIQDPRAGQGPGIGGFKKDSEIGAALKNGHPVYFVGFNATPLDGQTYEDIIKGQVKFYEKVAELHPNSPKMCAMGNCAAGYLTMFSAMQRPDLFGPIMIAGSPLSYWNGERGRYPMRYAGGLIGGSWINSLLGDLGGGKFDGTYLVLNFDLLNPANFLWSKQYDLYANIDKESERYLQFEKWWGDFIQFNTPEIKWLVDKLFVGNELTSGKLTTEDGIKLDLRAITSPIITFVSDGDNISPPAQSAGWIADMYKDEQEIQARGKTIVYCLNHKVGHLAIFTATKVGKREDELFVENMDSIDILAPGLYELVIDTPEGEEVSGKLRSHYEARTIADIKALGYNSIEDDRAFATVAKASEALSYMYDKLVHPWFNIYNNPEAANRLKNFRPLRLSYTLFADSINPWMKFFEDAAAKAEQKRVPVDENNPFWQMQQEGSKFITEYLQNFANFRDSIREQMFFNVWSNPLVQKFWGTDTGVPRYTPSMTQFDRDELMKNYQAEIKRNLPLKNKVEALFRFIALIQVQRNKMQEFVIRILIHKARELEPKWSDRDFHEVIKAQAMVVRNDPDAALIALKSFVDKANNAAELSAAVRDVIDKIGDLPTEVMDIARSIAAKLSG